MDSKKDKKTKKEKKSPEYAGEYITAPEGLDETKISQERRSEIRESAYRDEYMEKYACDKCGAEFSSEVELNKHISEKHSKKR